MSQCQKIHLFFSTIFFFLLCIVQVADAKEEFRGQCYSEFIGSSTQGSFSGHVESQPFTAVSNDSLNKGISYDVEVVVEKMTTNHASMDKKMYRMFKSDSYPIIRGSFQDVDLFNQKELSFLLVIQDTSNPIKGKILNLNNNGEKISFTLEFEVSLKRFHLKAPSFFGIMRVSDTVSVKSNFTLTKERA